MTAVLPTRLPVPITASVGTGDRTPVGGSKRKSGPSYGHAERQGAAREREALARPEHRLVGEVEHDVGRVPLDGDLERRHERDAVVDLAAPQLLGAADEHRGDDVVVELVEGGADDGRVVLAVDDRDHASHFRDVTSRSMRSVYFSYSNVSVENWMMRSSPWNGWRREIDTCVPLTSTTL